MITRTHRSLLAALTGAVLGLAGCGSSSSSKPGTSAGTPAAATPTATSSTAATSTAATSAAGSSRVASASAGTDTAVSASIGGVTATLHGSTHAPRVQQPWPIHFLVTRGGRAANASVSYEYLFAGQVVARRSHYTFDGHFSDVFKWPASAVGYPLTFRAVIVCEGATINLDYPVQVHA